MCPILFRLGPITVYSYGIATLAGFLVALAIAPRYGRRTGISAERCRTMVLVYTASGVLGARLLNVVVMFPEVLRNPNLSFWTVTSAGVWYGGVIAGLLAGWITSRMWRMDFATMFDFAAIPTMIGGAIGRFGCFLSGCCFGSPSDLPWAVTFTDPVAHRLHADLPSIPLHPVQIYEFLAVVGIALILDRGLVLWKKSGLVGLLWIAGYGTARTLLEFFRGDAVRGTVAGGWSTSQTIGAVSACAAVALILWRWRTVWTATPAAARAKR